jgi:O-antigen ligase
MHNSNNDKKNAPLLSRLLFHDDRRTEIFTYVCFSTAPILGSVASIAVNVGGGGGVLEVLRGIIPVSRDRFLLYLTIPIYLYCAAYLLALAVNPAPGWDHLLPLLTFLLFPFLYSSWCLSRKATVARSAINASMIACYGALVLAIVQFHIYGMRAEGGAGNAIVFATMTCMAASIALAGAFTRQGMAAVPLFAAYCAGSIAILYSGSRMTWLALFLSTAAVLWIYRKRRHG